MASKSESERFTRVRPLSAGGIELFQDTVKRHTKILLKYSSAIEDLIDKCQFANIYDADHLKTKLLNCHKEFVSRSDEFVQYLRSHRSHESSNELFTQTLFCKDVKDKVCDTLKLLDELIPETSVVPEQKGTSHTHKSQSSVP